MTSAAPAGILVVDKPVGPTSMAVCRRVRAALVRSGAPKRVKVGHGGTLDPLASGVLVVLVGKATRLCEPVMAGEKRYLADIDLAARSPTDDLEAPPELVDAADPGRAAVEAAARRFTGPIMQAPPAHSAMKIDGRRAYVLARAGDLQALRPRLVTVHAIDIRLYRWPRLVVDVRCGKGVYIRSLARDIGIALGTGGLLAGLRRTRVGRFSSDHAIALHALPQALTQADLLITPEVEALLSPPRPG